MNEHGLTVCVEPVDAVAPWCGCASLETAVKRPLLIRNNAKVFHTVIRRASSRQTARHPIPRTTRLHDLAVESRAERFWRGGQGKGAILRERSVVAGRRRRVRVLLMVSNSGAPPAARSRTF
jgi:hypothetical protein